MSRLSDEQLIRLRDEAHVKVLRETGSQAEADAASLRAVADAAVQESCSQTTQHADTTAGHVSESANSKHVASVPDGYVLVPVELTDEMLDAARRCVDYGEGVMLDYINKTNRRRWKAMLAAAKAAPC